MKFTLVCSAQFFQGSIGVGGGTVAADGLAVRSKLASGHAKRVLLGNLRLHPGSHPCPGHKPVILMMVNVLDTTTGK